MKLLYIEYSLAIHGGIERVLTDKINWLVEYGGCEVCLLLANQGNHPIVFSLHPKVEVHDLGIMFHQMYQYPRWKRYRQFFKLHQLFRQRMMAQIQIFSPDVIICTRLDSVSDVMKVRGTIPVVYESHNSFLVYKFEKCSWLQKIHIKFLYHTLKKVQMIVSLTHGDALEWKRVNPHVRVIPNVVHLNNTGRYSDCHSKSAIFVGRYSYQKDIQMLLHVWKLVSQRYPDWKLHFYGGYGNQINLIQSEIDNIDGNVVIHQPTSSIFEEYIKSSMLLMTSRFEPFGLVLPEAMSCGLPVVAFDCPYGPKDIIIDGKDGFLIKNRSINEYVDKVCLLMENEELRYRMGRVGVVNSSRYEVNSIMFLWKELFNQVMSHN